MAPKQMYYEKPGHIIAASVVLPLMDIMAVALRFQVRRKQRHNLKLDDWLMLPALVLTVGIGICLLYGVSQKSLAYPLEAPPDFTGSPLDIVTDQLVTTSKVEFAILLMLPITLGCVKASFLSFYMRIFSVNYRSTSHCLLIGFLIIILAWVISFFFATLLQCGLNMWAIWGSAVDLMTNCPNTEQLDLALSISDFLTDILIISFPIPLIWRLNLSTGNKIAVTGAFILGGVTAVASLMRLVFTIKEVTTGFDPDADEIFVITDMMYWGMVECGTGVFAACLPTLRSLFKGWSWGKITLSAKNLLSFESSKAQHIDTSDNHILVDYRVKLTRETGPAPSVSKIWSPTTNDNSPVHRADVYPMNNIQKHEVV